MLLQVHNGARVNGRSSSRRCEFVDTFQKTFKFGSWPILAHAIVAGFADAVVFLLVHGACGDVVVRDRSGTNTHDLLSVAVQSGHPVVLQVLLERGVVDVQHTHHHGNKESALIQAVRLQNIEMVKLLVSLIEALR